MSFRINYNKQSKAILALEDGTIFDGCAIGIAGCVVGELIFNTAMSGYQEILTDPSYFRQIIVFTCTQIGNVGVNSEDDESTQIWSRGCVVRDLSTISSNWRFEKSLSEFLIEQKIVGISDIDTRSVVNHIRERGSINACIMSGDVDENFAISKSRTFKGIQSIDLVNKVSTRVKYQWDVNIKKSVNEHHKIKKTNKHIVAYDFGIKRNILNQLARNNNRVTVVPYVTSAKDVLRLKPDGIFFVKSPLPHPKYKKT